MTTYRGRRLYHGLMTVLLTALLAGLVVLIYVQAENALLTLDMTESRQFSLSRETLTVLEQIERPVQITGFYSPEMVRVRELDAEIIRLYEAGTDGLIRAVYINPNDQPVLAERFALQYDGELFVSYLTGDGEIDYSTVIRIVLETNQERNITSAIIRLLELNRFTVAFEISYSEVTPYDTTNRGFSGLFNGLNSNGVRVVGLDLALLAAEGDDVSPEINTIVMTRMRQRIPAGAIPIIDRFLRRGGSLFIMADAEFAEAPFLGADDVFNDYLWRNYGIRMLDAVAIDRLSNAGTELDLLSYATSDGSSITARLNNPDDPNSRTLFRIARAVEIDPTPPVNNGMVIATSEVSYGETDLEALLQSNQYDFSITEDVAGPVNLAAWANDEQTGARILLVGDVDWATNGLVRNPAGNSVLFTDGITWLTGFGEQLIFAPQGRVTNLPTIFFSTHQLDAIAFITTVAMPSGMLLIGLAVWLRRSRR